MNTKVGRDIQSEMYASQIFNQESKTAKKLVLVVSGLTEYTSDGVKDIKGEWEIEIPLK